MPDPASSETDPAQPEGPSTSKEAQESAAPRPTRSVITVQEKQIDDLKREKIDLTRALEALRSKVDDLQNQRGGLAVENSKLSSEKTYSQVVSLVATVGIVVGSAMISSDSEKRLVFGLGWGIVVMGVVLSAVIIAVSFFRR